MLKFVDDAKLKFGVWNRERKERAEARKALHAATHSEHGHGRFFLLTVPAAATICAAIVEWYWALLFCIEATGHIDWNYETAFGTETAASNIWNFAFSAHWPVLVGLVAATVPIVMLSMVWLPVQFSMRGAGRWRRGSVIICGILANVLVIVSGTVVMNYNRQEQVREALVVEQSAEAQRTMLTASVDDLRAELDTLMNHRSTYVATAASVGAEAYERDYVRQARATNDPRLPLIERALGSARRADDLRAEIRSARAAVATAAPVAAVQANVEDTVGRELNTFAQYVEVWRPPFVALICTLIGIFGAWWVIALMQGLNPRDVLRSGWADEGHRIEDLREEEPIVPQPMKPAKRRYTDADTGEEIEETWVTGHKRERKVKPKKGEKFKVNIQPEIPPDETGVSTDGGNRTAVTLGGEMEVPSAAAQNDQVVERTDDERGEAARAEEISDLGRREEENGAANERDGEGSEENGEQLTQSEPPTDFEELAAQVAEESVTDEAEQPVSGQDENVQNEQGDEPASDELVHQDPRQPEQREDRMLAPPSVAAE